MWTRLVCIKKNNNFANDKYPEIIWCGWDKISKCFEILVIQLRNDRHSGIHWLEDDGINSNQKDQPHKIIKYVWYHYKR